MCSTLRTIIADAKGNDNADLEMVKYAGLYEAGSAFSQITPVPVLACARKVRRAGRAALSRTGCVHLLHARHYRDGLPRCGACDRARLPPLREHLHLNKERILHGAQ